MSCNYLNNNRTYYSNPAGASYVYTAYIPYSLKEINVTNESFIANYSFFYLWNLKKITINEGVTSIGMGAFQSCNNLISSAAEDSYMFEIPSTVQSIGASAFYECFSIVDFIVPNNVISLSENVWKHFLLHLLEILEKQLLHQTIFYPIGSIQVNMDLPIIITIMERYMTIHIDITF